MIFTYLKVPLHKFTFSIKPIREWVESRCEGKTLNLFAGKIFLNGVDELRNDIDKTMNADYNMDALEFVLTYTGNFNTILLDPPYSYRKSMEMYNGHISSPFNSIKNKLNRILLPNGIVITFGYHSVVMGQKRGFKQEEILLMSHGGAIHDTIAVIERRRNMDNLFPIGSTTEEFRKAIYKCPKCKSEMRVSESDSGMEIPCLQGKKVLYCEKCFNTEIV